MKKKEGIAVHKLAVFFPGRGYTCRQPLMQKCIAHYAALGYVTRCLDFSALPLRQAPTLEEAAAMLRPALAAQLGDVDWRAWDEVVFVSKSLGTVCAGFVESTMPAPPAQLYLTPLPQTLPYVTPASRVLGMVIGTEDSFQSAAVVERFCAARGIPCLVVPGVGHSLRRPGEEECDDIDRRILALCRP